MLGTRSGGHLRGPLVAASEACDFRVHVPGNMCNSKPSAYTGVDAEVVHQECIFEARYFETPMMCCHYGTCHGMDVV